MSSKNIENVVKIIPSILENFSDYLRNSANECLKGISKPTNSVAFIINIFTQPIIRRLSEISEQNKLEDLGLRTYLAAAITQTKLSLNSIIPQIEDDFSIVGISEGIRNTVAEQELRVKKMDYSIFFQPKFHPIIREVFNVTQSFLKNMGIESSKILSYERDFFDNIELQIINSFGNECYSRHHDEILRFLLKENEATLLNQNISRGKIGFKPKEDLNYETTYGFWKPVSALFSYEFPSNYSVNLEVITRTEAKLKPVEELIEQYFAEDESTNIEKILFLIADFGKGKSVFLKYLCAIFSKKYLVTGNGYFPVYFNLRIFKDYDEDHPLGVIGNFLEKKYGIKINDDYFRSKKFIFLIDSLDECGELNSYNINSVINSIRKIRNIDPILCRANRIIISSRPFDDGLAIHLEKYKPFLLKNDLGRDVSHFISIYGFQRNQFNNWLKLSLKGVDNLDQIEGEGLNKEVLSAVRNNLDYDFYGAFLNNRILSASELRRPIFAYMIFQLISNSISINKSGKIGVYLSFLNLLTKEAKYLHDSEYSINIKEQFEARNVLHSTAAIWSYNKNYQNKSEISKADICRVLEGDEIDENDKSAIVKFMSNGGSDIQFLSHSYFGDNNNLIHFQHQSFAEILLAEYYLKVIIKFSLEDEFDFEQARIRLSIGEPTSQVIEFFKELLHALKESVRVDYNNIEIRRLLFPLLASLATFKSNKRVFSNSLYYDWYRDINFEDKSSEIPLSALKNWPINQGVIDKIAKLCSNILCSHNQIALQHGEFKSSLFKKEVFISNRKQPIVNIDKWIVFITGNILFNDPSNNKWFNSEMVSEFEVLCDLLSANIPEWSRNYFVGMNANNRSKTDLSKLTLSGVNFSNSYLSRIDFSSSNLEGAKFENCTINDCQFSFAVITGANFLNAIISNYSGFALCEIIQGGCFPYVLAEIAYEKGKSNESFFSGIYVNFGNNKTYLNNMKYAAFDFDVLFGNLIKYGFQQNIWTEQEILDAFVIEESEYKDKFKSNILNVINVI